MQLEELDEKIKNERGVSFKRQFKSDLMTQILPTMLVDDSLGSLVDTAFGIDRRDLIAQSLRELATEIEKNYTLDDITRGFYEEEPARSADES